MEIRQNINKKALQVATLSFLIGTFILTIYLISGSESFLIAGVFYAFIALVLNSILFIELIANAIINYQYSKENLITILFFLINIPIALGYFFLVMNTSF
ncbi:hypothetical protein U6A24_15120 [Aquimarina gracilis]|uniref:Uncharacterized protein n=1 Tax=Aquimarina gracilis TaxID=874422 RepID=A0ABU5ZY29_9FLAO|nr:hypothetical protein [Aquimarina gracilis]MEB3346808.1 hypothetical protein [Aquimarina gracilis]